MSTMCKFKYKKSIIHKEEFNNSKINNIRHWKPARKYFTLAAPLFHGKRFTIIFLKLALLIDAF